MDGVSTYQFSNGFQIREEVAVLHKLSNETEWLLDGDTADEGDHMRIVALGNLLHCVNLIEKISPLTSSGTGCNGRDHEIVNYIIHNRIV